MTLRRYTIADRDTIIQLYYDCVHTVAVNDYTPAQLYAWASIDRINYRWLNELLVIESFVVEEDSIVIGFGALGGNEIRVVYTHKDHQGKGVATLLMNTLEEIARKGGIAELTLDSSITARTFYEKCGFIATKEYARRLEHIHYLR